MNLWQHYNNKKFYVIINNDAMLQENGVWQPAFEYICISDNEVMTKYMRTQDEFLQKFKNLELEV